MIPKDLLLAEGVVAALVTLQRDGPKTTGELTDPLDLSESTVRTRMTRLHEAGLITRDAALRNDVAVKVHELTDDGHRVTDSLRAIVAEYEAGGAAAETDDSEVKTEADTEATDDDNRRSQQVNKRDDPDDEPDEDSLKPQGFSFDDVDNG